MDCRMHLGVCRVTLGVWYDIATATTPIELASHPVQPAYSLQLSNVQRTSQPSSSASLQPNPIDSATNQSAPLPTGRHMLYAETNVTVTGWHTVTP